MRRLFRVKKDLAGNFMARQYERATRLKRRARHSSRDVADAAAGKPDDFVLARGRAASLRGICRIAFAHAGLDPEHPVFGNPDPRFTNVPILLGDPPKPNALRFAPRRGLSNVLTPPTGSASRAIRRRGMRQGHPLTFCRH